MARVRPFRAWRYQSDTTDITPLVAPPYDVITPAERSDLLARDPHNVVALELPEGNPLPDAPDSRYRHSAHLWDTWREGILAQDATASVYALEQYFVLDGREVRRRSFIAEVGLEPFDAGVVLPHERTLPKALGDRFELIKATGANLSQVFGMFDDPELVSADIFARMSAGDPVATATDDAGVVSTLWSSESAQINDRLSELLANRSIFIADGHHRYTTALAHRDACRAAQTDPAIDPAYDFVMMALVNMDDPELVVLPTHRVADSATSLNTDDFLSQLTRHFIVEPTDRTEPGDTERASFTMKVRNDDTIWSVRLRDDVNLADAVGSNHTSAWNELDVAVLQELILWPLLGIHPDHPETLDRLAFVKNAHTALASADDHDVAFVLRSTRMDQLRDVALAGETMPQKSTYFYPKLLSGLVFRSAR